MVAFILIDSFAIASMGKIIFCPVVLFQMMHVYHFAVSDSLIDPITFLFRALPQSILIYWVIYKVTSWMGSLKYSFSASRVFPFGGKRFY